MAAIDAGTSLEEIAALVSDALTKAGITATLSGGAAVSLYTDNEYESCDLDFITSERSPIIAAAIASLGFEYAPGRREFTHPDSDYYVEFPAGPLAFGGTVVPGADAAVLRSPFGPIRIVTPTHIVMDRLAAYTAWHDNQSLDQAIMVASRQTIDWPMLRAWAQREGIDAEVVERLKRKAARD